MKQYNSSERQHFSNEVSRENLSKFLLDRHVAKKAYLNILTTTYHK